MRLLIIVINRIKTRIIIEIHDCLGRGRLSETTAECLKSSSPNVVGVCCFTEPHYHRNPPLGLCLVIKTSPKFDGINREIDLEKS